MKILIDTSYFLPLIKISIEGISERILLEILIQSEDKLYYSDLSLFELTAKSFKYINKENQISTQDLMRGLDAIQNNTRLIHISWKENPFIIELAKKLRTIHKDTIDCLIFATAICNCDCIVTMDKDLYKQICLNNSIFEEIQSINKNFQFWFNDLSESPKLLKQK